MSKQVNFVSQGFEQNPTMTRTDLSDEEIALQLFLQLERNPNSSSSNNNTDDRIQNIINNVLRLQQIQQGTNDVCSDPDVDIGQQNTSSFATDTQNLQNESGGGLSSQLPAGVHLQPSSNVFYTSNLVQAQRVGCANVYSCNGYQYGRRVVNVGESRRQREELERRLGLSRGILGQQQDLDVEMGQVGNVEQQEQQQQEQQNVVQQQEALQSGTEASSASVPSFSEGLPQNLPSHQRASFENVDELVHRMDQLTMGQSGETSGQFTLLPNVHATEVAHQSITAQQQQQQTLQQQYILQQQQRIASLEAQLADLTDSSSSVPISGVEPTFGVGAPIIIQQQPAQEVAQQPGILSVQPVAEATQTGVGSGGPTLSPNFVKLEKPSTFSGKHSQLDNFIFEMKQFVASVGLSGQRATRFLVTFLKDDALTWWRTYCATHGGVSSVFTNVSFDAVLSELETQFTDVDKKMRLRNKIFNIKQHNSVQNYTTQFRQLMVELGADQLTDDTIQHLYLHGLKDHVRTQVLLQRPDTFEDMVLLAERADQAFMLFRNAGNSGSSGRGGNGSGGNGRGNGRGGGSSGFGNGFGRGGSGFGSFGQRGGYGNWRGGSGFRGGRFNGGSSRGAHQHGGGVRFDQVSQYGNQGYKGPAPMVLGAAQQQTPVCYYCNKPGHLKKNCFKWQRDQSGSQSGNVKGKQQLNMVGADVSADLYNILNLGMAAASNQQKQRAAGASGSSATGSKHVTFNDTVEYNNGTFAQTKN